MKKFLSSTWTSFAFLLPFVLLLAIHDVLGLSDALNVPVSYVGGRENYGFINCYTVNRLMVGAFLLGMPLFFLHTIVVAEPTKKGILLASIKIMVVVAFWTFLTQLKSRS